MTFSELLRKIYFSMIFNDFPDYGTRSDETLGINSLTSSANHNIQRKQSSYLLHDGGGIISGFHKSR